MKIGIQSAFSGATKPELIAAFGRIVEECGFHSLWVPEHVVFSRDYASRYPYSEDGRIPGDPDGVIDPLMALTFIAAHTRRIRLGTGILLVPQRNPVYTARQVSDLDYLSNGRFDFGIGVGWLKEEFESLDVPFERRGARTREYLSVMQSLWSDEVSSFAGEFYSLPECLLKPKPVQKPHPPVIFGGESSAALRRVAEAGRSDADVVAEEPTKGVPVEDDHGIDQLALARSYPAFRRSVLSRAPDCCSFRRDAERLDRLRDLAREDRVVIEDQVAQGGIVWEDSRSCWLTH